MLSASHNEFDNKKYMKIEININEEKINELLIDDNSGSIEEKIARDAKNQAVYTLANEFTSTIKSNGWQSYDKDTFLKDVKKEIDTQLRAVIQKYIDDLLVTTWNESELERLIGIKVRNEITKKLQSYVTETINSLEVVDTRIENE